MSNPYISLLKICWKYAKNLKARYVLIYSMFICANMVVAMNPLLYGWFIEGLQNDTVEVLKNSWIYAGTYLGLKLLEWAFHGPARVMERQLAFSISKNFLEDHYHKVLHMPVKWHQDNHSGSTINRLRKGYEALKDFFQNGFVSLHALGKFVFSFAAMIYFSPVFGSVAVLIGIFTIWVILQFDKPFIKSIRDMNEREHVVSSTLFDSLSNIITVITLRLEKRMEVSFMRKVMKVLPSFRRNVVINEWKWFTAQMLIALIYAIIVVGYVYQNWSPGTLFMIGGLVTLIGYINQFTSVFNDIASQYTKILQYHTDVKAAGAISEVYSRYHRPEANCAFPADWKSLTITNLSFSRGKDESEGFTGLKKLNLKFTKGQRIAIIGESGCGKSTLLALLRGLYLPEKGVEVKIDQRVEFPFESISNTVTLFPQEPEIFENTIWYNITLGLPFTKEEVMEVCDIARFSEVLKQLPKGLDTHIKEKGVNLSGGQKQRLALARGILAAKGSNIVLMDEPTSSVDPRAEVFIYDKIFEAFSDKLIISSLHRLHLLVKFDYVYIMKNGVIVDEGSCENLKTRSSIFQEMWQHQKVDNKLTPSP
ncbi:MAG TPA: ABC transporter ATP-binding protein [Cytophagaceae bacterium]